MKCVVLDDEPLAHQVLEHYISETPGFKLVAKFRNAVEAFEYLGKNDVELLFLDIEMPLVNGVDFLKALANPPKTIFTTAYKQYAFEGYELNAIDYLLKPFSYDRFKKAISKLAIAPRDEFSNTLLIKGKDGSLMLKQNDILYVEGCKDYVKIITIGDSHIIYHTLKGILERLNPSLFIQSHRSYLVNKMHIERVLSDHLIVDGQLVIPVGKFYKKTLLEQINA